MTDRFLFLKHWAKTPLRTASLTPSSRALASIMASEISSDTGSVLELGPGTGVFTKAVMAKGIPQANIILVELNKAFAALLKERYPQAQTLQISAADLAQIRPMHAGKIGAVLCGIGLPSLPREQVHDILDGAFNLLKPGGAFYQFTYGLWCPIPETILKPLGLQAEKIGATWRNFPPASVYRIARTS